MGEQAFWSIIGSYMHELANMLCMQAALEDAAQQAKARELETARLRAAQEKVLDTRAQLDELRARR